MHLKALLLSNSRVEAPSLQIHALIASRLMHLSPPEQRTVHLEINTSRWRSIACCSRDWLVLHATDSSLHKADGIGSQQLIEVGRDLQDRPGNSTSAGIAVVCDAYYTILCVHGTVHVSRPENSECFVTSGPPSSVIVRVMRCVAQGCAGCYSNADPISCGSAQLLMPNYFHIHSLPMLWRIGKKRMQGELQECQVRKVYRAMLTWIGPWATTVRLCLINIITCALLPPSECHGHPQPASFSAQSDAKCTPRRRSRRR